MTSFSDKYANIGSTDLNENVSKQNYKFLIDNNLVDDNFLDNNVQINTKTTNSTNNSNNNNSNNNNNFQQQSTSKPEAIDFTSPNFSSKTDKRMNISNKEKNISDRLEELENARKNMDNSLGKR
jgi:hypothetical protein